MLPSLARLSVSHLDTEVKRNNDGTFVLSPNAPPPPPPQDDSESDTPLSQRIRPVARKKKAKQAPAEYPMPILLRPKYKWYPAVYLLPTDELKKLSLRVDAVKSVRETVYERFYELAAQAEGVMNGDWEAAGIKQEDDPEIQATSIVSAPLEKEWEKVKAFWEKKGIKGIDVGNVAFVIHLEQDSSDFESRFDESFGELEFYTSNDEVTVDSLNAALDRFVEEMMKPPGDE
jgi:hypothetical protein